jgi:acetyltransferase-like isoleucine patch superfamily enzyme
VADLPPGARVAPGTSLQLASALAPTSRIAIDGEGHLLGIGSGTRGRFDIRMSGRSCSLQIGPQVVAGPIVDIVMLRGPCRLVIGAGTTFTGSVTLHMHEASSMEIGDDCMFAGNVSLLTSDAHPIYDREGTRLNPAAPIVLGRHVWVGGFVTILKGAHIGEGSVVARSALVAAGTYPPNAILAGVPARVVRQDIRWERQLPD